MTLIFSRIILTLISFYVLFLIWTKNVDLLIWAKNKITKLLPINEESTKGYFLDLEYDRLLVSFFRSKNKKIDGKIALLFYHTAIVNRNDFSSTIKEIKAIVEIENEKQTLRLYNINTGKLTSGRSALAMADGRGKGFTFIMDWENMQPKIDKRKVLLPGEVLSGSLVFPVDRYYFDTEIRKIKNIKLIITDFYGKTSVQEIKMDSAKFEILDENVFINDNSFIQKKDNTIEWGN